MQRKSTEGAGRKERRGGEGQRCFKRTLLRGEKKERYVERLWTTTTTSIPDKARRDETRQRSQLREQASERANPCTSFWRTESDSDRKEGGVVGREEGATSHKTERK
jgi:hypothetical protein